MRASMVVMFILGAAALIGGCSAAAPPASVGPTGAGAGNVQPSAAPGQPTTGNGGGGAGGATVTDPCSLLTQAEVSAAIGQQVGPGSSVDDSKSCDWPYPASGEPTGQATIGLEDGALSDMCGSIANGLGVTVTQVSGVGDGACFIEFSGFHAGTHLTFGLGGQTFSTGVMLGPDATSDQLLAADKALALAVLAHL